MSVKVNLPSYFQRYTNGIGVTQVDGTTVGECLYQLVRQFPDIQDMLFYQPGEMDETVVVCVNREVLTAWDEPMRKPVVDGDEISLAVLTAGG